MLTLFLVAFILVDQAWTGKVIKDQKKVIHKLEQRIQEYREDQVQECWTVPGLPLLFT